MLEGCRILVLQSEYLVAFDLQALFEESGALVTVGSRCDPEGTFDCLVIDSSAAVQPTTTRLAAKGVPLVAYSGNAEAVRDRFPDAIVVKKPALAAELLAGVRRALRSEKVRALCR